MADEPNSPETPPETAVPQEPPAASDPLEPPATEDVSAALTGVAPAAADTVVPAETADAVMAETGAVVPAGTEQTVPAEVFASTTPVGDDLAAQMAAAIRAETTAVEAQPPCEQAVIGGPLGPEPVSAARVFMAPEFPETGPGAELANIGLLDDVDLNVRIELGRTQMYIEDVLKLGVGSVIELDRLAGDPVDIYVNGRLTARGEVLVLNDNFCVRINAILSPVPELEEVA